MLACPGDEIRLGDLPPDLRNAMLPRLPTGGARPELDLCQDRVMPLRELEERAIAHALRVANGSVGKAARLLGIGRATLYRRIASFERPVGSP
jgi:transcriptional regulator of acetoin/glycerol metabolism